MLESRLAIYQKKLDVLGTAKDYEGTYLSREMIFKDILDYSDEEIDNLEKKLIEEASKYKKNQEGAEAPPA
jgi:hypothetical protein